MAGNVYACAGFGNNHLERIPAANVTASDFDTEYPPSNLAGSNALDLTLPFRHASPPAADRHVTIDKNVVRNGGGEAGDLSEWTQNNVGASNACANVGTPVNSGSRAFSLTIVTTGGGNKAEMYENRELIAGEPGTVSVALRGDGTRTVRARVFIPETGQYVTSAGALTTTPTDFATRSAATYATTSATFTAPAYNPQHPTGIWTLRLIAYMDGAAAGTCFMDDFVYWPHTDVAAVIGHDIAPAISPFELRRDANAFAGAGTVEAGAFATVYHPTMYALLAAMRTERYWRFRAVGTNPEALWYAKLFLGQKRLIDEKPQYGIEWRYLSDDIRQDSVVGARRVFKLADIQRRIWSIPWEFVSEATWVQYRDRIFKQSLFGGHPATFLIADADDPESCGLVLVPESVVATNRSANLRESASELVELSYPTWLTETG